MAKKDFSKKRERISFEIDGEDFEAAEAIPADDLARVVTMLNSVDPNVATPTEQVEAFKSFMETCLFPESYERFAYRMGNKANPIDLDQVNDISTWIVEQYGMRPTKPSADSSSGPPSLASGMSSTVEPQVVVSTSEPSLSTAS
jgi:hypothetical protein